MTRTSVIFQVASVLMLLTSLAHAEDTEIGMRAAATALSLVTQTDGELIVDTPRHAHFSSGGVEFVKIGECKYAENINLVSGHRAQLIDFSKLTGRYGGDRGELKFQATGQSNCWNFGAGQPTFCKIDLIVDRNIDKELLVSSIQTVQAHGCQPDPH